MLRMRSGGYANKLLESGEYAGAIRQRKAVKDVNLKFTAKMYDRIFGKLKFSGIFKWDYFVYIKAHSPIYIVMLT